MLPGNNQSVSRIRQLQFITFTVRSILESIEETIVIISRTIEYFPQSTIIVYCTKNVISPL